MAAPTATSFRVTTGPTMIFPLVMPDAPGVTIIVCSVPPRSTRKMTGWPAYVEEYPLQVAPELAR